MSNGPLVRCDNLVKIYKIDELEVVALQGLDLQVEAAELMAIIGPSGSGKTSLLNVLGALDTPSAGKARRFAPFPSSRSVGLKCRSRSTDVPGIEGDRRGEHAR